jgi:hypothetical protein
MAPSSSEYAGYSTTIFVGTWASHWLGIHAFKLGISYIVLLVLVGIQMQMSSECIDYLPRYLGLGASSAREKCPSVTMFCLFRTYLGRYINAAELSAPRHHWHSSTLE